MHIKDTLTGKLFAASRLEWAVSPQPAKHQKVSKHDKILKVKNVISIGALQSADKSLYTCRNIHCKDLLNIVTEPNLDWLGHVQ